jgi:diguanylate cyclase (GGDEF)-like protein/PAS domain S-box-containing protein
MTNDSNGFWRMLRGWRPDALSLLAIAFVTLVVAVSVAYWQSMLGQQAVLRLDAQQRNAWRAGQLNQAVTQQLDATLRSLDITLKHLRTVWLQNPRDLERAAREVMLAYPPGMIERVSVFDGQGRVQFVSADPGRQALDASAGASAHFRVHADGGADNLYVSAPLADPLSGEPVLQLTRGMWQDGRFQGVVGIPLRPDYLSGHLLSLRVDPADILAVVRPDGSVIACSHSVTEALKSRLPADRPFLSAAAGASGMFRSHSTYDKLPVLFSWQRLQDWPLITVAAVNEVAEMAALNLALADQRRHTALAIALLIVGSLGLALMVVRTQQQKRVLRLSEARHRALFEHSKIPMLVLEPDSGAIVDANEAATLFYGYSPARIRQLRIGDFNMLSAEQIEAEMALARQEKRNCFQFPHRLASGEVRQVEVFSGPIQVAGRMLLYSFIHDITDRKRLEDQVRQLAFHDALTALPNRRLMLDRINQTIAANRRTGQYCALLFLDLDHFKALNDRHGHEVGDSLLVEVARRLDACVREMDTVGRFGGDEFVVMLSALHTDRELAMTRAKAIAEKIRLSLAEPYVLTIHLAPAPPTTVAHHCTASLGLTLFCDPEEGAEALLTQADAAMYLAKQSGRNQTWLHPHEVQRGAPRARADGGPLVTS